MGDARFRTRQPRRQFFANWREAVCRAVRERPRLGRAVIPRVMPGLVVPGIHVFRYGEKKTWMAGTVYAKASTGFQCQSAGGLAKAGKPAMTKKDLWPEKPFALWSLQ
jgi:hypothetical protein